MILLTFSLILSLSSSILFCSKMKFLHWVDWAISMYMLMFAETILIFEILGLISSITSIPLFLLFQFILLGVIFIIWLKTGKPNPFKYLTVMSEDLRSSWKKGCSHPALLIFILGSCIFLLVNAWLILKVPPNTSDSLSTHLARVIHWIQNDSFNPWDAKIPWQVIYPFNTQIQYLKIILFTSSDKLVGFVQYAAALISFLAVYRLGLFLSASRSRSFFVALIWLTFPEIILQSTSTQNDLVLACFFTCTVLFLFIGIKHRSWTYLLLSALFFGIALGTKQTILFLLPGFAMAILFIIIKYKKPVIRLLFGWGVASLAFFFIFGAYIYIQNTIHFGSPAGPGEEVEGQVNEFSLTTISKELPVNISRLIYQAIDPSGLPGELPGYMQKFKAKLVEYAGLKAWMESDTGAVKPFNLRDLPATHEDSAWYGLTSVLLVFPAVALQFIKGLKKKDPYPLGLIAIAVGFLIFDAMLRPGWAPYQGRYFVTAATIAAPLITGFDFETRKGRVAQLFLSFLALVIGGSMILNNSSKALIGPRAIWGQDRVSMQLVNSPSSSAQVLKFADKYLPEGITFAVRKLPLFYEYILIGNDRQRSIVWMTEYSSAQDLEWLRDHHVDFLLLDDAQYPPPEMPPWAIPYENRQGWTIYAVE